MLRKFVVTMFFIYFSVAAAPILANTSLTGAYGYFTIPITTTPEKGTININTGFNFNPENLYISLNTAFIPNWEFSAGKEFPFVEDSEINETPYILGTKYRFYGGDSAGFRAAGGAQIEILNKDVRKDGAPISIYMVISENAGALGYVNTGLGYTFGIDAGYAINFFFGMRKPLVRDALFLIGEFTNYSVRQGLHTSWEASRGVFNTGLVLELKDFLKFKLVGYDLLDEFLTVGLGGEFRIKAF